MLRTGSITKIPIGPAIRTRPGMEAFGLTSGWILFGEANHSNTKKMSKYAPDLAKHRFYIWLNNYHWVPMIVLAVLLYVIGGFPLFLWGICLRVVFGLHTTWLVNSATHMWGSTPIRDSRRFSQQLVGRAPHLW